MKVDLSSVLAAEGLACGYRNRPPVLRGIDLAVRPGEMVVLVGPSGCGKTTLLKTLLGLLLPLEGRALLMGSDPASRARSARVGYVPQGLGLVGNVSVLRNVLMGTLPHNRGLRSLLGSFPAADVARGMEALERVGLERKASESPRHLSGGERRRVAVARALISEPEVLLADEMLSELDERTSGVVLEAVADLQRRTQAAVLMVEHDLDNSCEVADLLCCLGGGSLRAALPRGTDRRRLAREAMACGAPA